MDSLTTADHGRTSGDICGDANNYSVDPPSDRVLGRFLE